MNKQLEDIVFVFADLTRYWRQAPLPNGFGVTFTSTDRSTARQSELYGEVLSNYGPLRIDQLVSGGNPVAPPGTSQHEYGFAFDAVPNVPAGLRGAAQQAMGRIAGQLGLHWGGSADPVHFAMFSRAEWQQVLQQIGIRGPVGPRPTGFPIALDAAKFYGRSYGDYMGEYTAPGYIGQVPDPDQAQPG